MGSEKTEQFFVEKTKVTSVRTTSLEYLENLETPDLLVTSFADRQWSLTGSHVLES